MKKHIKLLFVLLFCAPVFAGCMLRLLQLLRYTDSDTGLLTSGNELSYIIYALLAVSLIIGGVYSAKSKIALPVVTANKKYKFLFLLLAASFFVDFVHRCISCYNYFDTASVIEYIYIIPTCATGIAALLCCLYFVTAALTAAGSYYDFTRFNLLHFSTVLWAFLRLIVMMTDIMDIVLKAEGICEFLFLSLAVCFAFTIISAIDKKTRQASDICIFTAISTFILAVITALPRLLAIISGKGALLSSCDFTIITYISIGVFALLLAIGEREQIKS